jgi:hypothetical protein
VKRRVGRKATPGRLGEQGSSPNGEFASTMGNLRLVRVQDTAMYQKDEF